MNTDLKTVGQGQMFFRWVGLCAVAELLGIGSAAVWYGAINVWLGEPSVFILRLGAWFLMSLAAVPEGLVLGGLQAIGIRWFLPSTSTFRWITATIAVGLLGWGMGTATPLFFVSEAELSNGTEPSFAAIALFSAAFGAAVGAIFGLAQAWALPAQTKRGWIWVVCNVIGWAVGLPLIYLAAQFAADQPDWVLRVILWALGGLGAGASVGVATGLGLIAMTKQQSTTQRERHP
jgi:hypothetical protein